MVLFFFCLFQEPLKEKTIVAVHCYIASFEEQETAQLTTDSSTNN